MAEIKFEKSIKRLNFKKKSSNLRIELTRFARRFHACCTPLKDSCPALNPQLERRSLCLQRKRREYKNQ
jgi:hypothetical protein